MPYKLMKKGNQTCVMKGDTGETVKCYMSHKDALDHMKALYANVKETENGATSFIVPIDEIDSVKEGEVSWLKFGGICLKPTVSRNNVKYTIDNIKELDGTSAKFFVTHSLEPDNSVGHVTFTKEGENLKYVAKIRNTVKHPDITESVKDRRVDVSIDARYKKIWREEDNGEKVYRVNGLEPRGLCAVGVGGIAENGIEFAIAEELGKFDAKIANIIKQEEEVIKMEESEQLKAVVQEKDDLQKQLNELKAQLQEEENAKKNRVIEELLNFNKEFDKKVLSEKSIKELEMMVGYEKRLAEASKRPSVGASEVDGSIKEDSPYTDILIEKEGDISMGKKLYRQFNEDIKNKIPRM